MTVRVEWHGREVKATARRGEVDGLAAGGEHLLGVSNDRVPLEEGTLMRSGAVTVDRTDLVAAVSYDTAYARRQHEELTWRHDPGRIAKFLELSLVDEEEAIREIVAAHVRRAFGGGS